MQASGGTSLDAGRLQALGHAVGAQSTFENPLGVRVELRHVERAPGHAVLAADAVILFKNFSI
jgi:hypothetical protein